MKLRGVRVKVLAPDGPVVAGWLISEEPDGVYLALDKTGREIRFIPHQVGLSITYDHTADKAAFAPGQEIIDALARFRDKAESDCLKAFSRVDFNRMRSIGGNYRKVIERAEHGQIGHNFDIHETLKLTDFSNRELGAELDRSGVGEALKKHSETIRQYLAPETLPALDWYLMNPEELRDLLVRAKEKNVIRDISSFKQALALPSSVHEPKKKADARDKRPKRLERLVAIGRIGLGGLLTGADISLAIFTPVLSALSTLGIGAVGAAATIMGSSYTGLSGCLDGIKELAESEE